MRHNKVLEVVLKQSPQAAGGAVPEAMLETERALAELRNTRQLSLPFELLLWKAKRACRYWLSRRSSQSYMRWEKLLKILAKYCLPMPRIVHNF